MYSGTTFRTKSGRLMGVHQKIDRVAHRHIQSRASKKLPLPDIHDVLHFEGLNGPDGIKRKSPAKDEPWHYIDPKNPEDRAIIDMINDHIFNLAAALRSNNPERAAFEMAWVSHAIVDGLTPAHHYPLEAKLEELRGGEGLETRVSTKAKLVLPGENRRKQLSNNWQYWGAKGVMTTHLAFELGVATCIAPLRFDDSSPSEDEYEFIAREGFEAHYAQTLRRIADMNMYEHFAKDGWTRELARETRSELIPDIIKTVTLAWYQAIIMAKEPA
jgi:hypothetical protein